MIGLDQVSRRARAVRLHARALGQIEGLRRLCLDRDACAAHAPGLSTWTAGDHAEHLLRAARMILSGLRLIAAGTDPRLLPAVHRRPLARLVLLTGWIPRGFAGSPQAVRPHGVPAGELARGYAELAAEMAALAPQLELLAGASRGLPHPALGPLGAIDWLRFLTVHNRHHLAIIDDIQRATGQRRP